mmetsp:Transcript_7934/g.23201  ORF Transcript_7934/g.23201 Transcript_7934/m.23201 type:complete len:238 (+) Transcript_7934:278-991(+)
MPYFSAASLADARRPYWPLLYSSAALFADAVLLGGLPLRLPRLLEVSLGRAGFGRRARLRPLALRLALDLLQSLLLRCLGCLQLGSGGARLGRGAHLGALARRLVLDCGDRLDLALLGSPELARAAGRRARLRVELHQRRFHGCLALGRLGSERLRRRVGCGCLGWRRGGSCDRRVSYGDYARLLRQRREEGVDDLAARRRGGGRGGGGGLGLHGPARVLDGPARVGCSDGFAGRGP